MEQKLNFNHNALTIEQLLQSRSNCSIVRAIGQFVHTALCVFQRVCLSDIYFGGNTELGILTMTCPNMAICQKVAKNRGSNFKT